MQYLPAAANLRSVAQLVEHRSPKPGVAGSIPAGPVVQSVVPPRVAGRRVPLVSSALPDCTLDCTLAGALSRPSACATGLPARRPLSSNATGGAVFQGSWAGMPGGGDLIAALIYI